MVTTRKTRAIAWTTALLIAAATPAFFVQHEAQAAAHPAPSRTAVENFATQVETLGVMHYPNSFTEAALTAAGVTDVYIPRPAGRAFISAVRSLDSGNYPVTFIGTQRSYAQLDKIQQRLATAAAELRGEGIYLADSYPDPSTGTVTMDISKPDNASITKLASFRGHSVTSASYSANVSSVLKGMFGSGATVGQETTSHVVPVNRNDDSAPFFDGDQIHRGGVYCTGGFNILNDHGSPFMLTAGHCGSGLFANASGNIGTTSVNWWPNTGYDLQAIPASVAGSVWLNNTATAVVNGPVVPALNTSITFDGYNTGRRTGTVTQVDVTNYNLHDGSITYADAHQVEGAGNLCYPGDSGGPVFTPSGGTSVHAVGIISLQVSVNSVTVDCFATLMTAIDSEFGLTLAP